MSLITFSDPLGPSISVFIILISLNQLFIRTNHSTLFILIRPLISCYFQTIMKNKNNVFLRYNHHNLFPITILSVSKRQKFGFHICFCIPVYRFYNLLLLCFFRSYFLPKTFFLIHGNKMKSQLMSQLPHFMQCDGIGDIVHIHHMKWVLD